MGRARVWVLTGMIIPLMLVAGSGPAAAQDESGGGKQGEAAEKPAEPANKQAEPAEKQAEQADKAAPNDEKKAAASDEKPAASEEKPAASDEKPVAASASAVSKKDELLPLDKRLQLLRSDSANLEMVKVQDPARIAPAQPFSRQEAGLPPRDPDMVRPDSIPELNGSAKQRWFGTPEWRGRFGELRRCPAEIARRRSVRPSAVAAGQVILRWTTDVEGRVRDAAVVGTGSRVDPDVMSCIHRKMSEWQFVPRPATPYRADWTLNLRSGR